MRRILLTSLLLLAPGFACAQDVDNAPPAFPPPWHSNVSPKHDIMMTFYAANTTHDGHLTLDQAKAANFKLVVDHFNEIDTAKRGYVTFYDIQAWKLDQFAKRLESQADSLRAMDNK